jgi:hypothetical protein
VTDWVLENVEIVQDILDAFNEGQPELPGSRR